MTDKLSLYNGALRKIKQRRLASLTENAPARYYLDDEYDKTITFCLEQGHWNFATRATRLEASTDVEPDWGYSYAFEKPDDYVRLSMISANDRFQPILDDFRDEADYWLTDTNLLYITYVSDDTSYGLNLSRWPQTFVDAVEYELAYRIAPHLTTMGDPEARELERRRASSMTNAKSKDAQNGAVEYLPPGRLVQSRLGKYGSSRNWQRRES
jgi:hypothetical protein